MKKYLSIENILTQETSAKNVDFVSDIKLYDCSACTDTHPMKEFIGIDSSHALPSLLWPIFENSL